jgi:septal ring factor EnvC (AmiA/AmiB activator)
MTMPKVETKPGTQDAPPKGQTPEKPVAPKMYSEEEFLKAVKSANDEKANSGRLKKQVDDLTKERDTFKKEAEETKSTVEETRTKLTELEDDLTTLADENASAADIAKMKKRIQATEEQLRKDLKAAKDAAEAEKEAARKDREEWAVTVSEAQAMKFEADVFEVAEEYDGGDSERLKTVCEKANIRKREDIEGLADVLWKKKAKETKEEPNLLNDSGATNGGGGESFASLARVNTMGMNPKELSEHRSKLEAARIREGK